MKVAINSYQESEFSIGYSLNLAQKKVVNLQPFFVVQWRIVNAF